MIKPTFCICKNKGADQLRSNCEANQPLYSTLPLLSKLKNFQPLAIFCACTAGFVLDVLKSHIVGFLMAWLNYIKRM